MCFPSTSMEVGLETQTPNLPTVKTGNKMSRLEEMSKLVNKAALDRSLFEQLKTKEVGTITLESQALRLEEDAKMFSGGKVSRVKRKERKIQRIRDNRNPKKVMDVLRLKIKYCLEK